jgi:hypothetical protein
MADGGDFELFHPLAQAVAALDLDKVVSVANKILAKLPKDKVPTVFACVAHRSTQCVCACACVIKGRESTCHRHTIVIPATRACVESAVWTSREPNQLPHRLA